jgi:sterol desaturase/sphingolipid hydroxylase (fatty acid hydroxylase superfamily)
MFRAHTQHGSVSNKISVALSNNLNPSRLDNGESIRLIMLQRILILDLDLSSPSGICNNVNFCRPSLTVAMKSTWRHDTSQWASQHRLLHNLHAFDPGLDTQVPVFSKSDTVPYLTRRSCHAFIIIHALWPLAAEYLYFGITGSCMSTPAAFALYAAANSVTSLAHWRIIGKLASQFGHLDGDKHKRDEIPDQYVVKILIGTYMAGAVRPLLPIISSFQPRQLPTLSPWLPVELALFSVVIDFYFYLHHRASHELKALWKYHKTHHLAKHPTPILAGFADVEQEVIEFAILPLLTYGSLKLLGLPMTFHDFWLCLSYLAFGESMGHSGLRIYYTTPSAASLVLQIYDCELTIEDHDLHHRNGWRKSHNYGKQTRLWDRVFGTCGERKELAASNIDFEKRIHLPLI